MVEAFEAQRLTKATEVLEHVEREEDRKIIYTSKLYQVPERQEPFFNRPTAGDLSQIAKNGTHDKLYKVNPDVDEIAQLLVSQGVVKDRLIAENMAAFILSLSEKTGVDPSVMVSNLIYHWKQTSQAQKEKIDPGIWGSLIKGVTNEEAKALVKNGTTTFQAGDLKIETRLDVHGNPYFMLNGTVIKGDGVIVGVKDGELKMVPLDNIDKNHDIYKYYKELHEQGYDVYYLYVGDIRKGKNVYTGLRIEHLDVNYKGSANYYGVSKLETTFVRKGEDVRVLQIRTLNVDGHYQQQYRLINLQDMARASSADFRWGDEKTTMWMKFSDKSIEKRTSLGYEDEFGRRFDQLFYKDENGLYHLDPTLAHVQFYNYDGTLNKEFYKINPENRVSFLLDPTILPIAKPVEKKVSIQYYNTSLQGPEYSLIGKEVSYHLSTDAQGSTGYYSFALVNRPDGTWMAVPGREFTYNGKTYHLTSQYLGEYIHTLDKDFIRVYLDENGNVVDERTQNYIDIPYLGITPNSLYLFASQTPQTFSTSSNVTYKVDGTTTVYGVAISQERALSRTFASATTETIKSQVETQILFPAKVNETIEMPSVTLSYQSKDKTFVPENASINYLPVFVTESGTQYLINQGLKKFGNYEVGENVFAIAKFSDGAWYVKVKDGKIVDAYTSEEGTWVRLDNVPEEAWQKAQVTEENASLVIKTSPVKIPYPLEIANSIKEVRAYVEGTLTVAGQQDTFSSYVSRELMPVEIPKPEVKPEPKPAPKEEKAPPQEKEEKKAPPEEREEVKPEPKEEFKPETKVKPEEKQAHASIFAPDRILVGAETPYSVRVTTDQPTDKKVLFALEDIGRNRYYLLRTNKSEEDIKIKIGDKEYTVPKEITRIGIIQDGYLYIRVDKNGNVLDPSSNPSGEIIKIKLGNTPQEWYKTLKQLGLASLFTNQNEEFSILPQLGERVLFYGFGIDEEDKVKSDVARSQSIYERPIAKGAESTYVRLEGSSQPAEPNKITFYVESDDRKRTPLEEVSAKVLPMVKIERTDTNGIKQVAYLIPNKDGKIIGFYIPGKGYYSTHGPITLTPKNLRSLNGLIFTHDFKNYKGMTREKFLEQHMGELPDAKVSYSEDKMEATLESNVPVPIIDGIMGITHQYIINFKADGKEANTEAEGVDVYVFKGAVKSASPILPKWPEKEFKDKSGDIDFKFDAISSHPNTEQYLSDKIDTNTWKEAFILYAAVAYYVGKYDSLTDDTRDDLRKQIEKSINAWKQIFLKKEIVDNSTDPLRLVYGISTGNINPGAKALYDLITSINYDNVELDINALSKGTANEDTKRFVLLAIMFNNRLNNSNFVDTEKDPPELKPEFVDRLNDFLPFARTLKEFMQNPTLENAKKLRDAGVDLKQREYYTGLSEENDAIKILLEAADKGVVDIKRVTVTEQDLARIGITWKMWESMTEEQRFQVVLEFFVIPFVRRTHEEEKEVAIGFGSKAEVGIKSEYADLLQNLSVAVRVGGKFYLYEFNNEEGTSHIPPQLLEQASVSGGAVYTRKILEFNGVRVLAYAKVEGRWIKDLTDNTELILANGSAGLVFRNVDGNWELKGAYGLDYDNGMVKSYWGVQGKLRVLGNGEFELEIYGNAATVREVVASFGYNLTDSTNLGIRGTYNPTDGTYGLKLWASFHF